MKQILQDIDYDGIADEQDIDDATCVWREIFKDRRVMAEGKSRHCQLYCDGLLKTCDTYYPLSNFNEVMQY